MACTLHHQFLIIVDYTFLKIRWIFQRKLNLESAVNLILTT